MLYEVITRGQLDELRMLLDSSSIEIFIIV